MAMPFDTDIDEAAREAAELVRSPFALPEDFKIDRRHWIVGTIGLGGAALLAPMWLSAAQASDNTPQSPHTFKRWTEVFKPKALAKGVSSETYDRTMAWIKPDTGVYAFDRSQPELQEPIWRYLGRRVNEWRINTGRERMKQHEALWDRLEAAYPCDRYIMCALWGMESAFGDVITNSKFMRPVLNSLAALAWGMERRRPYWEQEMINALIIVDKGWATPEQMIGSWAGAMGHTQWMPEVWLNMGVDFDRDGKIYPFGRPDDALAGTARYLATRGRFQKGQPWGYEVTVPRGFDASLADRKTRLSIGSWSGRGITRADGKGFESNDWQATLWLPAGVKGPGFLLTQNFSAIRSYNPSSKYALAIAHLADRIKGSGGFIQPWPTNERQLSLVELQELQQRLTAMGFDTGGTDGRVGDMTQRAVQAWQNQVGMKPADGFPTEAVLKRLRGS